MGAQGLAVSRSRHERRPPWAFALPLLPRRPHHHGLGVASQRQVQDDPHASVLTLFPGECGEELHGVPCGRWHCATDDYEPWDWSDGDPFYGPWPDVERVLDTPPLRRPIGPLLRVA